MLDSRGGLGYFVISVQMIPCDIYTLVESWVAVVGSSPCTYRSVLKMIVYIDSVRLLSLL